ncbi:DUF2877 domain-containing protein [Nocardioides halotolerans]|uniref:oxamate carbamoyltransferase subunit AllH family protein n=1 Tax=Nocardioides halotolerans TaxID=433660 RepID=UPI0012F8FE49|nr:DUF2877 domain-containing protein [Nocardioides halotolerans]
MSTPPRVAAHLRSVGDAAASVLHRGPDAVYVDVAGRCVGVVGTRATAVPCALRTTLDLLPDVVSASVRGGVLHFDDTPLVVGRVVDVTVPRLPMRGTPGPVDVAALVGRGGGLTPYGDDVLCGWLAVTRAAGVPTPAVDEAVRALAPTTTLLSATLLECAMAGEAVPAFNAWLAGTGPVEDVERIGHTSGRGLVEGARLALSGLERVAA